MRWIPVPHPSEDGAPHPEGYVLYWGLAALREASRDPRLPRGPIAALAELWRRGPNGEVEWLDVELLARLMRATLARLADGRPVCLDMPDEQVTEWLERYCAEAGVYPGLVRLARALLEAAGAAGLLGGADDARPRAAGADTTSAPAPAASAGSTS